MIGYWGYLEFEVNDDWMQYPSDLTREASGRYETRYPANTADRPIREFLGPEVGKMQFTMYLDQRFNSNLRALLDEFVTWVNTGWAADLVIGTKVYGYDLWVMTSAKITYIDVLHGGVIARAAVDVTLEEYG